MDPKTKQALKQDKFVDTTTHSLEWATEHRKSVMTTISAVATVILIVIVAGLIYNSRSDSAAAAFGAAMTTYQSPLTQPGEPTPASGNAYATNTDRAKAANAQFLAVANKYGLTPDGTTTRYFLRV